ncbi:hypothetical protein D3C76_1726860 [compost metagenome]
MPQRQCASAGQAIDEGATLDVLDIQPLGTLEGQGNPPWIAAGIGLLPTLTGQQRRLIELVERLGRRRTDPGRLCFDKTVGD